MNTKYYNQMRIQSKVLKRMVDNKAVIAALVAATNKSYPTIQRWIKENDEGLTLAASLEVIRKTFGLSNDEILEESKTVA